MERVLNPPSTLWESMMGFQNQPTTLGGAGSNPAPAPTHKVEEGFRTLPTPPGSFHRLVAGSNPAPAPTHKVERGFRNIPHTAGFLSAKVEVWAGSLLGVQL